MSYFADIFVLVGIQYIAGVLARSCFATHFWDQNVAAIHLVSK